MGISRKDKPFAKAGTLKKSGQPRRRDNISIRMALMLSVLVAIVPALVIITWMGVEFGGHLSDMARIQADRQVESFGEIQERISESSRQIMETLAALPEFKDSDYAGMREILVAVHARNSEYLNFTAVDINGIVTASSRLENGINLGSRRHFRLALDESRFAVGEYIIGMVDAEPSLAFALPIRDDRGRVSGAISAVYKLSSYKAIYEQLVLPEDATLGLVDHNGIRLFYHPPKAARPAGTPITQSVWAGILRGGDRGMLNDAGADGIQRYYAYRKLRSEPMAEPYLYVVFAMPASAATAQSRAGLIRSLAVMVGSAILALVIAASLSQWLFGSRLAMITAATGQMRDGNLAARTGIQDDSPDLGQIAGAIDLMAETLQRRDAERDEYAMALSRSLAEKDVLLKEIHHRVKNNLQLILSFVHLEEDACVDIAGFGPAIESRIVSMSLVHEMLYESGDFGSVELGKYTERLVELVARSAERNPPVALDLHVERMDVNLDRAIPFGLLLNELLINAFKHGLGEKRGGRLTIALYRSQNDIRLEVCDDGPGLPPGYDIATAQSLGLRLADALTSQLRGTLTWKNEHGACFTLDFPSERKLA